MWALPSLVAVATFLAFLPALRNGFVTWDDDRNFLGNPHYRGLGWTELRWMWTTFHMGHYVPLSWMTLGLDYVLWGMEPAGYHFTNLLLHSANAVVLWFVARRILRLAAPNALDAGPAMLAAAATFAALFFSLHPLRVESVVWVTERRDVLSGLFYSSTVLLYLRASDGAARSRSYWAALALFACALLSKASAVTLPAVLLLLNVYPLRRLGGVVGWWSESARRVYRELLPFAVLSAATAVLSLEALHPPAQLPASGKIAVSAYSLVFYLWKTVAPARLSPLYPMPAKIDPTAGAFIVSYVLVVALALAAWLGRRRWPGVAAAGAAFLIITFPMLGLVQNGPQIAADRYTYHAAPVMAILLAGVLLRASSRALRPSFAVAVAVLMALATLTWQQTRVWHDPMSLWSHVLRLQPGSSIGHVAMATLLLDRGDVSSAVEQYTRALEIEPDYAEGHNNLGVALAREGKLDEAVAHYRRALAIKPAYDEPHSNWGAVIAREGDLASAIAHYDTALALNPDNADAHVNLGNSLVRLGKIDQAIPHYREALRIRPRHAEAEHNWGVALARAGRLAEAIEHFQRALAIDPAHAEAKVYLEQATRLLHRG